MDLRTGDLLVARVWSWRADRLKKDAAASLADQEAAGESAPRPTVSAFAMRTAAGVNVEELMRELCAHIEAVPRSGRYVTFTTDRRLQEAGFPIELSEPPKHHCDVVLSESGGDLEFHRLESVFDEEPRRRFPSCQPA